MTRTRIVIAVAIAAVLVGGIVLPWALATSRFHANGGTPRRGIMLRIARPHPAATLNIGQLRTFEPGQVAGGDTIACASGKLLTEARVPARSLKVATGTDAWTKSKHASIWITWDGDRVVARCD